MKYILALVMFLAFTGCASIKDAAEDYVSEEVKQVIEKKIDEKLAQRGLSIAEIKSELDLNHDGTVTKAETLAALKLVAKDTALRTAERVVDARLAKAQANLVSQDQLDSKHKSTWGYLSVIFLTAISKWLHGAYKTNDRFKKLEEAILGPDDTEAEGPSEDGKA